MAKKKGSIFKKIFWGLFLIVFLALLGVSAFAASIYFGVLDNEKVAWVNEKIGLYKLPLIGAGQEFEYFAVPEGVVWPPPEPEPEPEPAPTDTPTAVAEKPKPEPKPEEKKDDKKSKDVKVSQKELEEQMKAREAAEKKRISKLARIYDNM